MKTVKLFTAFILFFLIASNVLAQTTTTSIQTKSTAIFRTTNSIELMGSSDVREIKIEITEDGCNFNLDISGEIQEGSMDIEIIDPKGKKRGSFSTGAVKGEKIGESKKGTYEERVNGRLMQNNTSAGTWIVKITPKNAHGRINARYQQSTN